MSDWARNKRGEMLAATTKISDRLRLIWPNHKEPNEAADLLDECERVLSLALITARRAEQDGYVQDCIAQFDAALAKLRSNEQ